MVVLNNILNFLKGNEKLLLYIALLLCVVFWHRSCQSEPEKEIITIKVPPKEGSFESNEAPKQNLINIDSLKKELESEYQPKLKRYIDKAEKAEAKNKRLLEDYLALEDDFEKYKLFKTFIKPQRFQQSFNDVHLSAEIKGIVRGEIESIDLDYTIKEQEVNHEIDQPRKKRFSIGPYFGYDLLEQKPSLGISINYAIIRF